MRFLGKQQGFSLVEMMLVSVVSVVLIQLVIEVYLSNKRNAELVNAVSHLQEDARFATHFFTQHVRMAGDDSCEKQLPVVSSFEAIHGYRGNAPTSINSKIKKGTDSIVLQRCLFMNDSQQIEKYALFVGQTSRKNKVGEIVYALYESPVVGDKVELIPNVTDMHVLYGVTDKKGEDVQAYLSADQVSDWGSVKTIEIRLLLSSENPVFQEPLIYRFDGKALDKTRYLLKEWPIYVKLRER